MNTTFSSTPKDLQEIFEKHALKGEQLSAMYNESRESKLDELANPGVKTVLFYGGFLKTEKNFVYNKEPLDVIEATKEFYFPETTNTALGDRTVMATSALVPLVKWIWEHEN